MALAAFLTEPALVLVVFLMAGKTLYRDPLVVGAVVTLLAQSDCVHTDKGKMRNVMVKDNIFSPASLIVTGTAVSTLTASVHIVLVVTGRTCANLLHPVCPSPVALRARDLSVCVLQSKFCLVMIKIIFLPLLGAMAGLALFSVAPLMFVIVFMTAVTGLLYLLLVKIPLVTGMAIYFFVAELQGKLCLLMVEFIFFPIIGLVAVLAFFTIPLVVHIVNNMAGITIKRGLLVPPPWMTGRAGDLFMLELQGKIRLFMVKAGLCPALRVVALPAVLAKTPLVRIVFIVTGLALRGGFSVLLLLFVALRAFGASVRPLQGKVREPVVKGLAVKDNGLVCPALVLLVTAFALNVLGLFIFTVKSAAFFYIRVDLFMTGKTEAFLRPLAKRPVALRALILVLGMPADNLAGHEQALNSLGLNVLACPYN